MPSNESINCAVCGSTALKSWENSELKRVSCMRCHHCQRSEFSAYDYTSFAMGAVNSNAPRLATQCQFLEQKLENVDSVLEIGCAFGKLAQVLKSKFKIKQYDAVEFSPAKDQAAKIIDHVFDRPLPELIANGQVQAGKYDLVIISHSLEHIHDLHPIVDSIKTALSPHGKIFIEVPNRSGHSILPFDDNLSHLHFFCISSLSALLCLHGLEIIAVASGAYLDERYPDSLRVLAEPFVLPQKGYSGLLQTSPLLSGVDKIIVWSAGKMVDEMLSHFLDPSCIAFFVDSDRLKQGSTRLGRPVLAPAEIIKENSAVILINSLEYEQAIREQITQMAGAGAQIDKIISIGELLSTIQKHKKHTAL